MSSSIPQTIQNVCNNRKMIKRDSVRSWTASYLQACRRSQITHWKKKRWVSGSGGFWQVMCCWCGPWDIIQTDATYSSLKNYCFLIQLWGSPSLDTTVTSLCYLIDSVGWSERDLSLSYVSEERIRESEEKEQSKSHCRNLPNLLVLYLTCKDLF